MKFNFKIQQHQTDAVDSVVKVFHGQPYLAPMNYRRDIGKTKAAQEFSQISFKDEHIVELTSDIDDTGFKNELITLTDDALLQNIKNIQQDNNLRISDKLEGDIGRCSLDVEMETGTGKTYVYIKTMYELNKLYGWSKFIVVVPSVAIREGVKKSFEITQEHFMEQYNKKVKFFIYNSRDLHTLDAFSNNAGINVMIINMQAFNTSMKEGGKSKEARIIYDKRDEFGSRRPIDVIKANNPIIILDEPQKMGGEATQKALKNFNPLFCLNYSATHKNRNNMVYVLDAVDAYNEKLVKKIEVKGFQVKNFRGTDKYMYLDSIIISPKHPPRAKIEFEITYNKSINRETRILNVNDNLYELSNGMEQYKGYKISEVNPFSGVVTFTNGEVIKKGDVVGDVSEKDIRRIQIRETIISHMEKEEELYKRGIKTLSLFFIDEVAKYRQYDDSGEEVPGEYGEMFEQEYADIVKSYIEKCDIPYQKYLKSIAVKDTHKGYFSMDKKGHMVNSAAKRGYEFSDDISAYDLILKNKERLLSLEESTRFIFSHSALREGWDNPNVFQICTLKHSDSTVLKRQEVGRGLRICVNQKGVRMDESSVGKELVHQVNKLTIIASESYKDFVTELQKQISEVLYERPTKVTKNYFVNKVVKVGEALVKVTEQQAFAIYKYLIKNDYIDDDEKVSEKYYADLENNCLAKVQEVIEPIEEVVHRLVQSIFNDKILDEMIGNGNETTIPKNELNENFYKKEFQKLWGYMNHKYAYTVNFDSDELIRNAIYHIDKELFVSELLYTVSKSEQKNTVSESLVRGNTSFKEAKSVTHALNHLTSSQIQYDLVGKIAEGTVLTRKTVAAILSGISPNKFAMFKNNPEEFIKKVIYLIREQKAPMIVEHISYNRVEGQYDSGIFTTEKHGSFERAMEVKKHIQDYVFTDGTAEESVERKFVKALEENEEVCVYAKLPRAFAIPTPVGNYSPDWAIAFKEGTVKHTYFVAETKGTMESLNLRPIEKAKILCARKLFDELLGEDVKYHDVDSYENLLAVMNKK